MKASKVNNLNLLRLGCTLHDGVLHINWLGQNSKNVPTASVMVRSIAWKGPSGWLFCLALETSANRALPFYCYLPIDFRNARDRKYLSQLNETGMLRLKFLAQRGTRLRTHQLTRAEKTELQKSYSQCLALLKEDMNNADFGKMLLEFESTVRISQFFERAMSEQELMGALQQVTAKVVKIPEEKRSMAHQVVRGLAEPIRQRWGDGLRKHLDELPQLRTSIFFLVDLHRTFGDDYDQFLNFIADRMALHTGDEELQKLMSWPSHLESILKLIDQAQASPETAQEVRNQLNEKVKEIFKALATGRGVSLLMLQGLLPPLRPLIPAQLGRPTKDYVNEHLWKSSGISWAKVTKRHYEENAEVRLEFGDRAFDDLTLEQRVTLQGRVRSGVTSYRARLKTKVTKSR